MKKAILYFMCWVCVAGMVMFSACSEPKNEAEDGAIAAQTDRNAVVFESDNDTVADNDTVVFEPDEVAGSFENTPTANDGQVEDLTDPKELDIKELAQFKYYADVGERYDVVMKPLKDTAEFIVSDLIANGVVSLEEGAVMTSVRYAYGRELTIFFRRIPKIYGTETDSEYLYKNTAVVLDNFGGANDAWSEYASFLRAERGCEGLDDYVEIMLPHAGRLAGKLKAQYEEYKAEGGLTSVRFTHQDSEIVLKADSPLTETRGKMVDKLNRAVAAQGLPLITDEDIKITFNGNIYREIVYYSITLSVDIQNLHYHFRADFNADGEFTEEWINYFKNERKTGYWSSLEALYVPQNDEYAEFFDRMQIENIDFTEFFTYINENTFLDF